MTHAVHAQETNSIAGVVRDGTGAVLPGVTVEAASPALIEKVRTALTDGEGQYRIVNLRPGTYSVTFTLPGFSTVKRDGVELTGGFTVTVNAELRVGALEETVTVTGASPLVDTQNVRQQRVVGSELLEALPVGRRSMISITALTPGITSSVDVGGSTGVYLSTSQINSTFHGKQGFKVVFDGMRTTSMEATGGTAFLYTPAAVQEVIVDTGGNSAESSATGVLMNLVPKEGSNDLRLTVWGTWTNDKLQGSNLTDELRGRGLTTVGPILYLYEQSTALGGPIKRDKIWFFTTHRFAGNKTQVPGQFFNLTQGTPFYTPDLTRPGFTHERVNSHS